MSEPLELDLRGNRISGQEHQRKTGLEEAFVSERWRLDLGHATRALRDHRGSAAAFVAVVAIGVGLAASMVSLSEPYLWRPLPYRHSEQLWTIEVGPSGLAPGMVLPSVDMWQKRSDALAELTAFECCGDPIDVRSRSSRILPCLVASNFFEVLGVEGPTAEGWLSRLEGGGIEIASTARGLELLGVNESSKSQAPDVQIVSVLPNSFLFPDPLSPCRDVFIPYRPGPVAEIDPSQPIGAYTHPVVLARLKPGVAT